MTHCQRLCKGKLCITDFLCSFLCQQIHVQEVQRTSERFPLCPLCKPFQLLLHSAFVLSISYTSVGFGTSSCLLEACRAPLCLGLMCHGGFRPAQHSLQAQVSELSSGVHYSVATLSSPSVCTTSGDFHTMQTTTLPSLFCVLDSHSYLLFSTSQHLIPWSLWVSLIAGQSQLISCKLHLPSHL